MALGDKITVIIDVVTDKATAGINSFKTSVKEAEGFTGKLKAGTQSLGQTFGVAAKNPAVMAGAVTAVAGAAIMAAHAFEDTAKTAIDLGAATGLSTEQASRWVAVGDDLGITAEELTKGIGRLGKTLNSGMWEKYGIETRDAAGNARDANDIMLDALDVLGKVKNETERTRIGNDLFGRGYASLAPLIGKTRAEYEGMLGSVERGQVITEKEAKKAERLRLAEDALSDALNEVTMAVGEIVAEMAPFIEQSAEAITTVTDFADRLGILDKAVSFVTKSAGPAGAAGALYDMAESANALFPTIREGAFKTDDASRAFRGLSKEARDDADALDAVKSSTDDLKAATEALLGTLDQEDAWDNYAEKLWAANDGINTSEKETRDLIRAQVALIESMDNIPEEQKTKLIAQLEQGDIDLVNAWLAEWRKGVNVPVRFAGQGNVGFQKNATGTPSSPGGLTLVGENGPELVNMPRGAQVFPAAQTAGMLNSPGGGNVTINALTADPRLIMDAIQRYARRGGRNPW